MKANKLLFLDYLKTHFETRPLFIIIVIAVVLRLVAGLYNYTPMQEDDYANVISPALNKLQTGIEISTVDYRIELLPQLFYGIIYPFSMMGIDDTRILVALGLAFLGLLSLSTVVGMYRLGEIYLSTHWRNMLALLTACYFLMPLIATRAFQESFTLLVIPWAFFYFLKPDDGNKRFFYSALFFGITAILRFQSGLLAVTAAAYLVYLVVTKQVDKKALWFFTAGALASVLLFVTIEIMANRKPFSTLINYVLLIKKTNLETDAYGGSPWYTYIGILLAVFIPPFSLALLFPFLKAIKKAILPAIALISYVFVHSLIGNKLERFILPVIPLFLLITFIGLETTFKYKIIRFSYRAFWVLNLILVIPVCFARSQSNIIDAASYLKSKKPPVYLFRVDLFKQGYYGYDRPPVVSVNEPEQLLKRSGNEKRFYLLHLLQMNDELRKLLQKARVDCTLEKRFHPDFLEKLVIMANPEKNKRRNTTFLYLCSKQNKSL